MDYPFKDVPLDLCCNYILTCGKKYKKIGVNALVGTR